MPHIRQKNMNGTYTVVESGIYANNLSGHPAMLEHPDIFEITNDEFDPDNVQYLVYESPTTPNGVQD